MQYGDEIESGAVSLEAELTGGGEIMEGRVDGLFSASTNFSGDTVWTSWGEVEQDDFREIVNDASANGETVNILTSVHGDEYGAITEEPLLYFNDQGNFSQLPGAYIQELFTMPSSEVTSFLNGPGTTIAAFCYSDLCLKALR